ncbi:hypothetical protein Syun_011801 [Stephania yunnanensis]|uniref:Neprosin domain-containing protein n=1 Tax=Stephania yunnanensis TaxID=152371 RepID=A0AAP0JY87_9MAGN
MGLKNMITLRCLHHEQLSSLRSPLSAEELDKYSSTRAEYARWAGRCRTFNSAHGRRSTIEDEDLKLERQLKIIKKLANVTIKTSTGDVYACVDIHQQPALDHPMLKNHKVQFIFGLMYAIYNSGLWIDSQGGYKGVGAEISVEKVDIATTHFNASHVWVSKDPDGFANSLWAGWMTNGNTGCFNTYCSGFVVTNKSIPPTIAFKNVSQYEGTKIAADVLIDKDVDGPGHWRLYVDSKEVGYWPNELVPTLNDGANNLLWGSVTLGPVGENSSPMGNGRLPDTRDYKKSDKPNKGQNKGNDKSYKYHIRKSQLRLQDQLTWRWNYLLPGEEFDYPLLSKELGLPLMTKEMRNIQDICGDEISLVPGPGGRIAKYTAIVACGNYHGVVGYAKGKGPAVPIALQKAYEKCFQNLHYAERYEEHTIAHAVQTQYEKTKVVGSRNPHNTVKALFKALNAKAFSSDKPVAAATATTANKFPPSLHQVRRRRVSFREGDAFGALFTWRTVLEYLAAEVNFTCGGFSTMAITEDGKLWNWGEVADENSAWKLRKLLRPLLVCGENSSGRFYLFAWMETEPFILNIVELTSALWLLVAHGRGSTIEDEDLELERQLKIINKPANVTIKTSTGDVYACVDIHQQPALDHPMLKNHKVQLRRTSSSPKEIFDMTSSTNIYKKAMLDQVDCPDGTVPIKRVGKEELKAAKYFFESLHSRRNDVRPQASSYPGLHSAVSRLKQGGYKGVGAEISVEKVDVAAAHFSASHVWVSNDPDGFTNSLWAGWMTTGSTGCFNTYCSGFVVTNKSLPPTSAFKNVSVYGGTKFIADLLIDKDVDGPGHWRLYVDSKEVGYWPNELVPTLNDGANHLLWGSVTLGPISENSSPMGNGRLPDTGDYKKSSFFFKMTMRSENNYENPPTDQTDISVDCNANYGVANFKSTYSGASILYGGPGGMCS